MWNQKIQQTTEYNKKEAGSQIQRPSGYQWGEGRREGQYRTMAYDLSFKEKKSEFSNTFGFQTRAVSQATENMQIYRKCSRGIGTLNKGRGPCK